MKFKAGDKVRVLDKEASRRHIPWFAASIGNIYIVKFVRKDKLLTPYLLDNGYWYGGDALELVPLETYEDILKRYKIKVGK